MTATTEPRVVVLTRAQRAVLGELVSHGSGDPAIAASLQVSLHTVKTHMKRVIGAFGVENRTQVVIACLSGQARVRTVRSKRGLDREDERISA